MVWQVWFGSDLHTDLTSTPLYSFGIIETLTASQASSLNNQCQNTLMLLWLNSQSHIKKSNGKPSHKNGGYYFIEDGLNLNWDFEQPL